LLAFRALSLNTYFKIKTLRIAPDKSLYYQYNREMEGMGTS
jgi:hypothetical protein